MKYLVKLRGRSGRLVMGDPDGLRIAFPEIHRTKRTHRSPIGQIREMEGTGKYDRTHVELRLLRTEEARWTTPAGSSPYTGQLGYISIERSRETIRILDKRDEMKVAAIDANIAELQEQIRVLRRKRGDAVRRAWRRAAPLTPTALAEKAAAVMAVK